MKLYNLYPNENSGINKWQKNYVFRDEEEAGIV